MSRKSIVLFLMMCIAALITWLCTPHILMAQSHQINLETMIPAQFNDWKTEENSHALVKAPDVEAAVNKLYSNLLMRTYINSKGERMMLSVAYGRDQRDNGGRQVHRPEACYPAQGFNIVSNQPAIYQSQYGEIPVRHLVAQQNKRTEPITYWLTIGLKAVNTPTSFKINQLSYGIKGYIPDGMLVRVSSIDDNTGAAFKKQAQFLNTMIAALPGEKRKNFGFN